MVTVGAVASGRATALVVYATVQSSEPSELLARIVMVPEPTPVGIPLKTRVVVSNARPAGREPTTAYAGVGLPVASGTVTAAIAVPTVQVCASPVSLLKTGAVKIAGSPVLSVRVTTVEAVSAVKKSMSSLRLFGFQL